MKKRYLHICMISIVVIIILIISLKVISYNKKQKSTENLSTLEKGYKDINNGNSLEGSNTTGEVKLSGDSLVFEDKNGNTMTYSFEGEDLKEIEWRIKFENEELAVQARKEYEAEEFKKMYDCKTEENILVLRYTDEYIKSYQNMTRSEIEDNLIKGGYQLKK